MRAILLPLAILAVIGLAPSRSSAQISPGKLSRAHAELDSSRACLECHSKGKGVSPELCLSCHGLLGKRIEAGAGLHSQPAYRSCETCHIEHHGRDFELIWWGDAGVEAFDHAETGYPLKGAHRLACGPCHRPSQIAEPETLTAVGKNLERTFLGLETACSDCHEDEHRGQMAKRGCADCHDENAWRPASGFDHDRTRFALDGRHDQAPCKDCHATEVGEDGTSWKLYRGLATACADCHRDPHDELFGRDCAACHTASDWRQIDLARFDHDRTRYSLRGRHRSLDCASCHRGTAFRISGFERCATCHVDVHVGQFRDREGGDACSDCHDVGGFKPSRFGLADHAASSFPLEAAHSALACDKCHQRIATTGLIASGAALPMANAPTTTQAFRMAAKACVDCHHDPHIGSIDAFLGDQGCKSCHHGLDWRKVNFDHGATEFDLEGAHRMVACIACHEVEDRGTERAVLSMKAAPSACRDCHLDPHLGQFDLPGALAACRDCHSQEGWTPSLFDHNRDSPFLLEGKHALAECFACHFVELVDGREVYRYRPLPTACSGCHRLQASPSNDH